MSKKLSRDRAINIPPLAVPLLIGTALCFVLYFLRVVISGTLELWFINWNLILAWVPIILSVLLVKNLKKNRWLSWQNLGLSFLWLLFLPNAFYLVTDFVHLDDKDSIILIFDVILIMTYALTGLALGWFSVLAVHNELKKRIERDMRWVILLLTFLSSSFAIYLGRNLGWNSWNVLTNPWGITLDVFQRLANPDKYADAYSITALLFIYIAGTYLAFYTTIKAVSHKK